MSRIFEALQKSEVERSGNGAEPILMATELLIAAERQGNYGKETASPATVVPAIEPAAGMPDFPAMTVSVPPHSRLVCLTDKESLAAEKFRFLGVRLRQLQLTKNLKRVLVTSTIPEEGKSMVTANLVITLARKKQQRILLIEGDLRRPVLAARLGLPKLPGLSEWLVGERRPVGNIYHLPQPGFWFMPAGVPPENPLELMQSGRLSEMMEHLTAWFDWIVIDSPPVLPLADTSVWTRLADGVLLVTREGTTEKRQLQRGLQALEQNKLLGVVLNSSTNTDHTNYYQRYGPLAAQPNGEK